MKLKKQNVRTLSLVVCTFTYLLIGAAVFDALESDEELRRDGMLTDAKNALKRRYNISDDDYKMMELVIIEYKPHKAGPQWKFAGAFYFATVVLAMIGYGHSTPVTAGGKAFCMGYAMVGIPLGLVMFQSIGERLNKFASVVIRQLKKYLNCKKVEATEMNLMFATGMLSSIIITTGAAVFSRYEGWTYFDSFYYCFVTLTTIGFGDYVALQNDNALQNKPGYVALSLVFILFGLAVVAASINLLVLRFMTMNAEDNRAARSGDSRRQGELAPSPMSPNYGLSPLSPVFTQTCPGSPDIDYSLVNGKLLTSRTNDCPCYYYHYYYNCEDDNVTPVDIHLDDCHNYDLHQCGDLAEHVTYVAGQLSSDEHVASVCSCNCLCLSRTKPNTRNGRGSSSKASTSGGRRLINSSGPEGPSMDNSELLLDSVHRPSQTILVAANTNIKRASV